MLRPQDILLLGLADIADLLEGVKDPFGILGRSYKQFYGFIPSKYKRSNFNHLVWRNLKTGYIEKIIKNGSPYLRITSSGRRKIKRDFLLLVIQKKKWDGKWRLAVFDIKEKSRTLRNRFRKKLKELGFGMLQESVFISPYDLLADFSQFLED